MQPATRSARPSGSASGLYTRVSDDAHSQSNAGDDGSTSGKAGRLCRYAVLVGVLAAAITVAVIAFALRRDTPAPPLPPPVSPVIAGCEHPVYCKGPLLRAVQLLQVFNDSKTFVDMPIRGASPQAVLDAFASVNASDKAAVAAFVAAHFDAPEAGLEAVEPEDFVTDPAFLAKVNDTKLRGFARAVHNTWRNLTRRFRTEPYCDECVSALKLPHPFVAPGGRFREFYYWDSFWILKGLLVSQLTTTARYLVQNIAALVDEFGFMPNGARRYYLDRSQPPVLSLMVDALVNGTGGTETSANAELLDKLLPTLAREHRVWRFDLNRITVPLGSDTITLFRYATEADSPRPESYLEDYNTLQSVGGRRTAADLFANIHAGAETGWDFSTRWFKPGTTNMAGIVTMTIAPIDLNIILLRGAEIIADIAGRRGDAALYGEFAAYAREYRAAMLRVFRWSQFRDVLVASNGTAAPRQGFYAAIALAGFVDSFVANLTATEKQSIVSALQAQLKVGGIPTSDNHSGQQWDWPNAWPPMQWFAAAAFGKLGRPDLQQELVRRWVQGNYCGYSYLKLMIEKYNAEKPGWPGGGGEYTVQLGFGWTNGVVLEFLSNIGETATAGTCDDPPPSVRRQWRALFAGAAA